MELVPSYIDKIMCKYSFDKTETEYIENCLLELYKTKKLIGEDIKYWIKSFTDAVHANRFYIDVICEQDLTKYYHRYYRTKRILDPIQLYISILDTGIQKSFDTDILHMYIKLIMERRW